VDELKSNIYQQLERQLSPRDRVQLASIEKTWLHFRMAHCQEVIEPFGNSSMVPLLYHNCLSSMTLHRIADLQNLRVATISPMSIKIGANNSIDRVH
jgi:uncharacterized protein YecT (DUF1311 family)